VVIARSLQRGLAKTRPALGKLFSEESQLPSITVAIPARNETSDLEDCLNSLIGSDYPKMEILVLDDCSQEKRTPEIIRSYAHSGVRFLAGEVPGKSWTAKNFAYEQLAAEANGEVIVFCGVDIRFNVQALRKMIELKIAKKKKMISFMPVNQLPGSEFKGLLVQPLRYLWELGIPRRYLGRPPVLSSCWLIDRQQLMDAGSFMAYSRSIIPERYIAREVSKKDDGYSFIAQGAYLGLSSAKSFDEQLSTAVRTKYPLLKQRLEHVAILSLLEFWLFLAPIGLFIYELVAGSLIVSILSALAVVLASLVVLVVTRLTYGKSLLLSLVCYPLVVTYDILINLYSMWCYEFSEVVWKGRNVCIPVMQLITPNKS
jgi:glycosyltransferase involved in cell wall biosynthesis